jgi:hypothetical protein
MVTTGATFSQVTRLLAAGWSMVYVPYKQIWSMCPTNKSMRLRFGVILVYVPYKQIYALWRQSGL